MRKRLHGLPSPYPLPASGRGRASGFALINVTSYGAGNSRVPRIVSQDRFRKPNAPSATRSRTLRRARTDPRRLRQAGTRATGANVDATGGAAETARRSIPAAKAIRRPTSRPRISPRACRKISGDAFEGRKPGTIGERMTTAWIKDQFEQMGLKPGNSGNWFQTVPMVETTLQDPESGHARRRDEERRRAFRVSHRHDRQYARREPRRSRSRIRRSCSPATASSRPSTTGTTTRDSTSRARPSIVLVNDPGWGNHDETLFKGKAMTYYGRWTYKYEEAARQGAAACLIVHETRGAGYPWDVVVNSWTGPQDASAAARGSGAASAGRRLAHDRSRAALVREGRRGLRRAQEDRRRARLQAGRRSTRSSRRISRTASTIRARKTCVGMIRGSDAAGRSRRLQRALGSSRQGSGAQGRPASTTARSTTAPASPR